VKKTRISLIVCSIGEEGIKEMKQLGKGATRRMNSQWRGMRRLNSLLSGVHRIDFTPL
jgi:hypothetical protein